MLAFMAPDMDKIGAVEQEVKRFKAWTSIMSDKDDLNLDGGQIRETDNNLKRSNDTVDARLKEAYCWLLVPYIDQFGDMKTIQWEISDVGGGSDSLVTKASRKMLQAEQIITKWAPALLQMCLDDLLWKDANDISIKKLWEYLTTYCYLPRLSSYSVLEETICQGVASTEYFALAAAYNGERYVDLKFNQTVFTVNPSDLLVKVAVAQKQIEAEKQASAEKNGNLGHTDDWVNPFDSGRQNPGENTPSTGFVAEGKGTAQTTNPEPKNKHFYMSVKLDNTRANRDMNNYMQEIIQHLMSVDGANVELKLEVQVNAPNGVPASTVRTVSENCKTLKVDDFGFDD
ncbi:MAG: hypothetical protein ACI4W2_01135 [Eubacterium sp.]